MTTTTQSQVLNITKTAAKQLKELMSASPQPMAGLRLSVRNRGCSGKSYELDYIRPDQINPHDEVIEKNGVKVFVDAGAVLFVFGSTMDYQQDGMSEGFVFNNPNEKGRCGCGESFHI